MRETQYVATTPQWCPGLMQTTSQRTLQVNHLKNSICRLNAFWQGAEADAARAMAGRTGEDKEAAMRRIVAGDLADSDDEELSKYGQEVKAGLTRIDKFQGGAGKARVGASGDLGRKEMVGGDFARGGIMF